MTIENGRGSWILVLVVVFTLVLGGCAKKTSSDEVPEPEGEEQQEEVEERGESEEAGEALSEAACEEPNPAGCAQEGCPLGQTCVANPEECAPSNCRCINGDWACTRDCAGGGVCEGYEPCAGKVCGESCTICAPDDEDCMETMVMKYCNEDGVCEAGEPACAK